MSIGNLKDTGNQGNNFPFQLKVLQGLQCACDQLKEINIDTDDIELLLTDILNELTNGLDVNVTNGPGAAAVNIQDGGNSITVDGLVDVDITHTDDSIQIYASDGVNNVPVLVGTQACADALSVTLCSEQSQIQVQAHLEVFTGTNGDLSAFGGTYLPSISFASIGTANALVRVDGTNVVSIPPGTTLNYDAGGVGNFYDPSLFTWDTSTNAGASLIVTYNYY